MFNTVEKSVVVVISFVKVYFVILLDNTYYVKCKKLSKASRKQNYEPQFEPEMDHCTGNCNSLQKFPNWISITRWKMDNK